jgi:group II intron reverse transcriptase/maturase
MKRGVALSSLHHVIDLEWMKEAYRLTRKDGAPGIDGVTADDYATNLEANLLDLLDRIKSGRYKAPPVRRTYIPKADGSLRPLGIPSFEDKVAQRAIVMVLEAVYEQDFLPCSFGFRPGRSAHQALQSLHTAIMSQGLRWVVDMDIVKYFDSIPHSHLRDFLDQRVTDGVIRRMIDKWLKAGVLEDGLLRHATEGSPQGGVISPCLSNIFLHHVLDEWFELEVRPRLKGRCTLVRFADDAVMAFEDFLDAKRVLGVLGKRLARYGLLLHPDKTRFVDFRNNRPNGTDHPETNGTSFTFLGFTHIWGKSLAGKNVVRQVTAKNRYARALAAVTAWCRRNRHQPIPDQSAHLTAMMRGHYCLLRHIGQLSTNKLVRPSGREDLAEMVVAAGSRESAPLGPIHCAPKASPPAGSPDRPSLHLREQSSSMKNRKRESCTSGTVRDEDGNILIYSARPAKAVRHPLAAGVRKPP